MLAQNKPGVNGKNSLSSENDIAPLPGGIYGKDVALEFPLPEGWAKTESRNNSGVDTAGVSDYDNSDDAPVYEPYRPGQDIQQFDHTLWEERKAETAQECGLSEVESESVDSYVGGSAYEWNAVLRGDENYETTAYYDYWIQQATAAFKKFPQFKGRTYRNLTFNSQDILNKFLAKHERGKTVTADSFLSSSKDPNGYVVSGDYVVHMVIDGISGRDISDTYSIPGQQEVVYLPGTELYITAVKTANDGNPLIYVQEVRTNGKDMETNTDGNGQSSSGANYEGQAGNAERKGHDLGGIHGDRGVGGNGGARDARQVQQSGSSSGYGRLDGDAEQGTKHSLSKQADELAPIGNSRTSDKNLISEAAKMYFSLSDPGPNAFAGNPVNPPKFSN